MATPENLADPLWRLANIYCCREEGTGSIIPLRPRPEQTLVLEHLVHKPDVPLYIIKSRRLGVSTIVDTFMADCAVFKRGFHGQILDQKQDDATKKMVEIVRFAIDSLPKAILNCYTFINRNDSELRLRLVTEVESEERVIYATVTVRGGDCSMLHVSEWGPISAVDPKRSNEIRTGALPAARRGRRVVETTWYGGKSGDLWDLVKPIMDANPNAEGEILFFPWHNDPKAVKIGGEITPEIEEYFRDLTAKVGKDFNREQKLWYAAKKLEQGLFVKREYPSTLDEALSVPMAGTIYGDLIDQLREKKRIQDFPGEKDFPAYTFWDIGMSDYGCVWLVQFVGRDILLLDYVSRSGQGAGFYVGWVRAMEQKHSVTVRENFMPHDADARDKGTGKSYKQTAEDAGLTHVRIVHRTPDIWLGINELRALLPRCFIHAKNCTAVYTDEVTTIPSGVDCLENYHKKEETSGGIIRDEPVHDGYSHGCILGGTPVETDHGRILIENIRPGMMVKTPCGYAEVEKAGAIKRASEIIGILCDNGLWLEVTPEHMMFTNNGLVLADTLRIMDGLWTCNLDLKKSDLTELPISFRDAITSRPQAFGKDLLISTEPSGQNEGERFPRDGMCITRTGTPSTIGSRIWSAFRRSSIYQCTRGIVLGWARRVIASSFSTSVFSPPCGTDRRWAVNGTEKWQRSLGQRNAGPWSNAKNAAENTARLFRLGRNSATTVVRLSRCDVSKANLLVYDLSVRGHHCYLANGLLVSNSDALRTMSEAHRLGMIEGTSMTARETRLHPIKVLRGAGPQSYSVQQRKGPRVLR